MAKAFYSKKEAAEFLGVSLPTIENYIRRGQLTPLYPPGPTAGNGSSPVRFAAAEIENFFSPKASDLAD
jgi:predicted site-specific integrase-resolvase